MSNNGTKLPEGHEWVEDILAQAAEGNWVFKKNNKGLVITTPQGQWVNNMFVVNDEQQSDITNLMAQLNTNTLIVQGGKRR